MTPQQVVKQWIDRVREKRPELLGMPICPFAPASVAVVAVDKLEVDVFTLTSALTIYVENTIVSTPIELENLCYRLNTLYEEHIFLPDHPSTPNYINGVSTGNNALPLIIAQTKDELLPARRKLEKTNYYDHWDENYLNEIKSFGD